jgi:ribose/xylose/arabinose/galactoside ABC-type transport system permease subunit
LGWHWRCLEHLVGVLIVNVIGNGMVVVGLPGYIQDGVLGMLVIIAVGDLSPTASLVTIS